VKVQSFVVFKVAKKDVSLAALRADSHKSEKLSRLLGRLPA